MGGLDHRPTEVERGPAGVRTMFHVKHFVLSIMYVHSGRTSRPSRAWTGHPSRLGWARSPDHRHYCGFPGFGRATFSAIGSFLSFP
jgi:hypothetical protein